MVKGVKITRCYTDGDFIAMKRSLYKAGIMYNEDQLNFRRYQIGEAYYNEINFYIDNLTEYQEKVLTLIDRNWRKDVEKYSHNKAKDAEQ